MKAVLFTFLVATIVVVQCNHLFLGTNFNRPMVHHQKVERSAKVFRKTIENFYYELPAMPIIPNRMIQGILAVDLKGTEASANVTRGGIGLNFCNIRMKSERGRGINYDIYIYV